MSYTHLTIEERCCLREYYVKGYSYRQIAKMIGRNVSTVYRELNRNFTHMYEIPTYFPQLHKRNTYLDVLTAIEECFKTLQNWNI